MNLSAIYSKTGKGVQEASGKTSHLSRGDRAVLAAIDGRTPLTDIQPKFEKIPRPKFEALIQELDKEGFIRQVSAAAEPMAPSRPSAPAVKAPPSPPPAQDGGEDFLDFTQLSKVPPKPAAPAGPKPPPMDLAAASRAEAERKAKEQQQAMDYKARQEAEARQKAEAAARAKAEAEAKARAATEAAARAKAEAEARAKAATEAEAKARAEADAKVKAAREAAVRMATEAKAKAEAEARAVTEAAERERQAAEERARREAEDKARLEAELNAKLEAERRAREDAERRAAEAAEQARKELEEKAKRDAEEMRKRLEEQMRAEMEAKLEAERKAREEDERKRREEEDRRRKEEEERRKEEEERRAKEDAERRAREDEERKRREEEDRRRKEEDERRAKEEAERKARAEAERREKEEAERKAKEESERKARAEAERREKEEAERKAREADDRRRREEEDRRRREEDERRAREDSERKAKEEAEAGARAEAAAPPAAAPVTPPTAAAPGALGDDLLADLDSFGKREEEERLAKEEAERKAKEEAQRRAKEEAERKAREEADRKRREEDERRRKEEEERRAQEEAERQAREEADREKQEEEERKRKAKEAQAAKQAAERKAKATRAGKGAAAGDDDIEVSDEDLEMDDIRKDHKALSRRAEEQAREREQVAAALAAAPRPKKWGKPVAIAAFAVLVGGLGVVHVMPLSTADYEKAASDALGVPVKIGSARISLVTGIELKFETVSVGDKLKARMVRASPDIGSLFGAKKSFSRVEVSGAAVAQDMLADALLGKAAGENFRVGRVLFHQVNVDGPLKLAPIDVDATMAADGTVQSVKAQGAEKLMVQLSPRGNEIGFEINSPAMAHPLLPALTLSEFHMKGTANRSGVSSSEFDGRAFDGVISGTARIRWGAAWQADGEVRARGVKVAVFAPALVSDGKVDGRATYTMSGASPEAMQAGARMQGEFKIEKGVLGSFDLTRALQSGGSQSSGRTVFNELTGQGVYDRGAMQFSNVALSAGAMNASAVVNIDANGGLAGRVVAEVKTPSQTLRATLNLSGKVQDPVIRK